MKNSVVMGLLAACLLLSGETIRAENAKKVYTIGMSQCSLCEPWRVQMNADVKKEADRHPEIKMLFKDAQNDTLIQAAQVREFINSKVDLIIITPKETAPLTKPVAEAIDKGIPVIVLNRRVLGDKYTCYIGADNEKIGKAAGEWIKNTLGGKGNVVELEGLMTSTPCQERHKGFKEGIKGSGIKIIFRAEMKGLEDKARGEMESALSAFDKIDLVFSHNDSGAHGAYLAAKAAGREKDILFVGIDGLVQEGQAYLKQGILNATFLYPTGGKEAVLIALDLLKNGKEPPKEVVLGTKMFTKDNIDQGGVDLN